MVWIVASRGRNPENPNKGDRGLHTEQRLEINSDGICNCLTSVQKDNLLIVPCALRFVRDDFAKKLANLMRIMRLATGLMNIGI